MSHNGKLPVLCRYGLREALAISSAEGLESLWARHQRLHEVGIPLAYCGSASFTNTLSSLASELMRRAERWHMLQFRPSYLRQGRCLNGQKCVSPPDENTE